MSSIVSVPDRFLAVSNPDVSGSSLPWTFLLFFSFIFRSGTEKRKCFFFLHNSFVVGLNYSIFLLEYWLLLYKSGMLNSKYPSSITRIFKKRKRGVSVAFSSKLCPWGRLKGGFAVTLTCNTTSKSMR